MNRILIISFVACLTLLPTAKAEDLSAGAYASVSAKRLLVSFDKNGNSSLEKQELDRQWRSLGRWNANHDDVLSAEELVKHAYYMLETAKAARAPVEVMIIKSAGHNWREAGAAIEPTLDQIVERTVRFLSTHLNTVE